MVEGSALAKSLGTSCNACDAVAPAVLCFQQSFWSPSGNYMVANSKNLSRTRCTHHGLIIPVNGGNGRSGKDANTILASISTFDATAGCDAATFQPCSDKALANHKVVTDSFRSIYAINSGIPAGQALAVGRYAEDSYYGGNPWYLNTLAAAEQLYYALYVWKAQGSITVTSTSLAFFRDLVPGVNVGTYAASTSTYSTIISAVAAYADGYISVVERYTPSSGAMAEQFSRSNGSPLSAADLTWSYAALLTATDARAGAIPPSWNAGSGNAVPGSCARTSVIGSYVSATATSFPPSQTPGSQTATGTATTPTGTTAPTSTTATACTAATSVAVTFSERVTTTWGQTIKIVGDISALGSWNTNNAIALSAANYTSGNPLWFVTINLAAGQVIQYKYIIVASNGAVTWEKDPNHTYTVPASCATAVARADTWQS